MVKKVVKKPIQKKRVGEKRVGEKRVGEKSQSQSQNVTINLTRPTYAKSTRQTQPQSQPQKTFLPMMPSFNINPNQPSPSADLAKLLGLLNKKLETESNLGEAIHDKPKIPLPPKKEINGLIDRKQAPSLGDAIEANLVIESDKPSVNAEPIYETTVEDKITKHPARITSTLRIPKPRQGTFAKPLPEEGTDIRKFLKSKQTTFGIGGYDSSINSEKEFSKQFPEPTGYSSGGIGSKMPVGKFLGSYYSQSDTENENETPILPSGKSKKLERLDLRYEKAFGIPYQGGNIKQKDFLAMIQEQEQINKEQKNAMIQEQKAQKAQKKKSSKK